MRRMYSEKQLENIVDEHLEVSDVKVKTLEQSEPNWSLDIETFVNITGGTATPIFCRIQQINQELHFIFLGKIENTSGSTIQAYQTTDLDIELPQEIAEKIYDYQGYKASETPTNDYLISYTLACGSKRDSLNMSYFQTNLILSISNSILANHIKIKFARTTNISIDNNETLWLEGRVYLDLI